MKQPITSSFSISSSKFDSKFLKEIFPWRVIESSTPVSYKKTGFHVTVFDFDVGRFERVDQYLVATKKTLLKQESELNSFFRDCNYTLWIAYCFPSKGGVINVNHSISAALALLHVELIFHLKPRIKFNS